MQTRVSGTELRRSNRLTKTNPIVRIKNSVVFTYYRKHREEAQPRDDRGNAARGRGRRIDRSRNNRDTIDLQRNYQQQQRPDRITDIDLPQTARPGSEDRPPLQDTPLAAHQPIESRGMWHSFKLNLIT